MEISLRLREIQDGIADDLPRGMICGLATTLDREDRKSIGIQHVTCKSGSSPQRDDRRMLAEQEHVAQTTGCDTLHELLLEFPDLRIGTEAQVNDRD
jgi:hypothetical protein